MTPQLEPPYWLVFARCRIPPRAWDAALRMDFDQERLFRDRIVEKPLKSVFWWSVWYYVAMDMIFGVSFWDASFPIFLVWR